MKFKFTINIKSALEAGLGGFISAYILGLPVSLSIIIGLFCAMSGSYTDVRSFLRQLRELPPKKPEE